MTEVTDGHKFGNSRIRVKGPCRKTYRTVAADPGPPRGWGVHHPKMLLHAVRASCGFGNQMRGRRFRSLDLYKTFRAYRLVATPRVVYVRRVILIPTSNVWLTSVAQSGEHVIVEWFCVGQRNGDLKVATDGRKIKERQFVRFVNIESRKPDAQGNRWDIPQLPDR